MSSNNFFTIPEGIKFFLSESRPKFSRIEHSTLITKNDDDTISVPKNVYETILVFKELQMLNPNVSFLEILVSNKISLILKLNPNKKLSWVSGRTVLQVTQLMPNGSLVMNTKNFNPKAYKNKQISEAVELLSVWKNKPTMDMVSAIIMLRHIFPDIEKNMLGKIVTTKLRFDLMVELVHQKNIIDDETLELFAQSPPSYIEELLSST